MYWIHRKTAGIDKSVRADTAVAALIKAEAFGRGGPVHVTRRNGEAISLDQLRREVADRDA
jgi:hypothetical protein